MNSVQLAIAAVPVAIYLLLIGSLRLRKRPLITSGWRDTLRGNRLCGIGGHRPHAVVLSHQAAARWLGWVWLLMFGLYFLTLFMLIVWSKPRLIVYGLSTPQFRDQLLQSARAIDDQAFWQDEVLTLPQAGIQLAMEPSVLRNVHQVAAVGLLRNLADWVRLEKEFVRRGRQTACAPARSGWLLVLAGLLLLTVTIAPLLQHPEAAYAELQRFLLR